MSARVGLSEIGHAEAMKKPPTAPKGLTAGARSFWTKLQAEYVVVDAGGLALLEVATRAFERMEQARAILKKEGVAVRDRWGQVRAHPLVVVERDARSGLLMALRNMNLDIEPTRQQVR